LIGVRFGSAEDGMVTRTLKVGSAALIGEALCLPCAVATQYLRQDRVVDALKQNQALEGVREVLLAIRWPRTVRLQVKGCDGEANAGTKRPRLTVCYEFLDGVWRRANSCRRPAAMRTRVSAHLWTCSCMKRGTPSSIFSRFLCSAGRKMPRPVGGLLRAATSEGPEAPADSWLGLRLAQTRSGAPRHLRGRAWNACAALIQPALHRVWVGQGPVRRRCREGLLTREPSGNLRGRVLAGGIRLSGWQNDGGAASRPTVDNETPSSGMSRELPICAGQRTPSACRSMTPSGPGARRGHLRAHPERS
jgi:hypothetical protein